MLLLLLLRLCLMGLCMRYSATCGADFRKCWFREWLLNGGFYAMDYFLVKGALKVCMCDLCCIYNYWCLMSEDASVCVFFSFFVQTDNKGNIIMWDVANCLKCWVYINLCVIICYIFVSVCVVCVCVFVNDDQTTNRSQYLKDHRCLPYVYFLCCCCIRPYAYIYSNISCYVIYN